MFRFTMPSSGLSRKQRIVDLNEQFDAFLNSEKTQAVLEILDVSVPMTLNQWKAFLEDYDLRKGQERLKRNVDIELERQLEKHRNVLYDAFSELGMIKTWTPNINKPNRILVLGSSYKASYNRTASIGDMMADGTISDLELIDISALGTYRIISPEERDETLFYSDKETEFGVLSDCFSLVFGCKTYMDEFELKKNTNQISCIRTFENDAALSCRIYSAPSSNPIQRANSNDTYKFYLSKNDIKENEKFLLITDNAYRNYQFIPFAMQIIMNDLNIDFDIVGSTEKEQCTSVEQYDPIKYLQNFNAIIDWIIIFKESLVEIKS